MKRSSMKYKNGYTKKYDFSINGIKKPEYLIFFEKSRMRTCFKNTFSMKSYYNKITEEFQKKNIHIIEIDNFVNDADSYQCANFNNTQRVLYDGLKYPCFGVLYILFDTYNFVNQQTINYYTVDRYSFQMKSYVHDFLIFLSQSFGAKSIRWSYSTDKTSQETNNTSVSTSYQGVTAETGVGSTNDTEKKSSTDLVLSYDNNGSEIFFETTNNELPWCIKIQKIICDSNVPYDVVKYRRNDLLIAKFLENNKYFRYEFYIENDLLVDFVRKRQNGMNEVHHEMVFYDKHRSMFNYCNELGMKYFTSMGFSYSSETSMSEQTTTFYHVDFYQTYDLESITLRRCIVEDKSIMQMKRENNHTISKIREMQTEWEEYNDDAKEFKYQYYGRMVTIEKNKDEKDNEMYNLLQEASSIYKALPKRKKGNSCCGRGGIAECVYDPSQDRRNKKKEYIPDDIDEFITIIQNNDNKSTTEYYDQLKKRQVIVITENEIKNFRKTRDVITNVHVILQRYKRYFDMLNKDFNKYEEKYRKDNKDDNGMVIEDVSFKQKQLDHKNTMKKKKFTFITEILNCFYNILYKSEEHDDEEIKIRTSKFRMDTYIRNVPDEFFIIIIDHILNAVDMEGAMTSYLHNVRYLIRDIEVPVSKDKERVEKQAENLLKEKLKERGVDPTQPDQQEVLFNSEENKNKNKKNKTIDAFLNIKLVVKSQIYLSLTDTEKENINKNILDSENKDSDYSKYMIIQEAEEAERNDKLYENVTKIRLVNKDGGNNYASCDGIYVHDDNVKINNYNPYVNKDKDRFIGRTGKGWTLTGMQWFDAIIKESKEAQEKGKECGHYFGGFHGAINETESIALSKWKEYEVIVCDDTENK